LDVSKFAFFALYFRIYTSRGTRINSRRGDYEEVTQKLIRHPEGKRQVDRTFVEGTIILKFILGKYVNRRKGCG
jgi:hypothetical protein